MCYQDYTEEVTEESRTNQFVMKTLRKNRRGGPPSPHRSGEQEVANKSETPPPRGVCFCNRKIAYFAGGTAFG